MPAALLDQQGQCAEARGQRPQMPQVPRDLSQIGAHPADTNEALDCGVEGTNAASAPSVGGIASAGQAKPDSCGFDSLARGAPCTTRWPGSA